MSTPIRDAQISDAASIAAIYNQSIAQGGATMEETPWTPEHVRHLLQAQTEREGFLVIERAGAIVGWSRYKRYSPRRGYRFAGETATYLDPQCQGMGLGTALKHATIQRCRALGYHHLVARVFAENDASIRYNLRLGYELVGIQREVGFRDGRWIDVAILQLIL